MIPAYITPVQAPSVDQIRARVRELRGKRRRRYVALEMGVAKPWLIKFEQGVFKNPTADNLLRVLAWIEQQQSSGGGLSTLLPGSP